MSRPARFALLFVVFVDLLGQGLVFPIINSLIMSTDSTLLAQSTPTGMRHVYYGVVIGAFFLSWFLGVVYVSRVSDAIGRKNALLICLCGAFVGYVLTIAALFMNSLILLILGRSITAVFVDLGSTGFTAPEVGADVANAARAIGQ